MFSNYAYLPICLRYKCDRLEPVSDVTKADFSTTVRSFVTHRGRPAEVGSENGRNFFATAKVISNFLKLRGESLSHVAEGNETKYSFIPGYNSHFCGIWEAGIKTAKYPIKRVLGNIHLSFEEKVSHSHKSRQF